MSSARRCWEAGEKTDSTAPRDAVGKLEGRQIGDHDVGERCGRNDRRTESRADEAKKGRTESRADEVIPLLNGVSSS